jgi:hypothetical protein
MARRDFLPDKDQALLAWAENFGTLCNLNYASYGITKEIADDYVQKKNDFATKLQAATDPSTRGKRTVFLKDESKRTLVELTRKVVKQITGMMTVTDAQRQELGITVPSGSRTPVPPPSAQPFIQVTKVKGRTVTIELRQEEERRGKPAKVTGAQIYTCTGTTPPEAPGDWVFMTAVSKTTVELPFGPSSTGDTVWITASWTNAKNETGPAADEVRVNLPAGGVLPAEAGERTVRRAA